MHLFADGHISATVSGLVWPVSLMTLWLCTRAFLYPHKMTTAWRTGRHNNLTGIKAKSNANRLVTVCSRPRSSSSIKEMQMDCISFHEKWLAVFCFIIIILSCNCIYILNYSQSSSCLRMDSVCCPSQSHGSEWSDMGSHQNSCIPSRSSLDCSHHLLLVFFS